GAIEGRYLARVGDHELVPNRSARHHCFPFTTSGSKPPKIMRLPSNGMPIDFMRGSSIILSWLVSAVLLSGHVTHENTIFSPFSAFTARRKSVTLPSLMSDSQPSTRVSAPCSLAMPQACTATSRYLNL